MLHIEVVAAIVCLLLISGSTCQQQYTLGVDRSTLSNNEIMLRCFTMGTTTQNSATFYRQIIGDSEMQLGSLNSISHSFTITRNTEGYYYCKVGQVTSNMQPINAFPDSLSDITPPNGIWGEPYTAECQYSFGALAMNLSGNYNMTWTVDYSTGFPINPETITFNTTDYSLIGTKLIVSRFTPIVDSLVCHLTVIGLPLFQGNNPATQNGFLHHIGLEGGDKSTSIVQPPLNSTASVGDSAEFQCTASVPQIRTVMFEVFGENITSSSSSCNTGSSVINRICSGSIANHPVTLTCDYSVGYRINCTLRIDNLMENESSIVSCKILNDAVVEATMTAELIVQEIPSPTPSVTTTTAATTTTIATTIPTTTTTTTNISSSGTPMTTSTPTAQPTDFIFLISAVVLSALVLIVLLLLITIFALIYFCKKNRNKTTTPIEKGEAVEMIPAVGNSQHGGQYRIIPTHSPQRSITPSDDRDNISFNHTEITGLPSSQDSTPSHYSRSSRRSCSNHSQCTCVCHNSYIGSHLEPPKTLPLQLARYGYPDVDIRHTQYPCSHHEQNSIDGAPKLKLIPPTPGTPNTPGTEPFSVPSPVSPGQSRPDNLKFNAASSPGYGSTPVSGEVAFSIAMYLMHKDCPDKANCPTCNLINTQFHHLMKRYETSHNKDENRRDKLRRRRSMKSTPKSLHPPTLGRQRSHSTSQVNADELTLSSNEDSSTDAEVLTEPEDRHRKRDFSPLPLGSLSRNPMAYVSDSELAASPSGHIPSPRRLLSSPTKIHLKPIPPSKEDRLPSSDSLPTDESDTSSRQGSDSYDLQGSLPLPSQRCSFSGTSGYDTVASSDTESLFLPIAHSKQLSPEVRSSTDTEMHHRRRHADHHHHHSHSKKTSHGGVTRSLQNAPRQGLNPSQRKSDFQSNESFHSFHSAKSDMVQYSQQYNRQREYQRPSSSSPCRSRQREQAAIITLPHASSQQTDL